MAKKVDNLKDLKKGELDKKLIELRESLRVLRFKAEGARSKNVKESLSLKKQVARVLTMLNKNNK